VFGEREDFTTFWKLHNLFTYETATKKNRFKRWRVDSK